MSDLDLGNDYEELLEKEGEELKNYKIYDTYNAKEGKLKSLKVLKKEQSEEDEDEYDVEFFLKQIEKEGNILKQFNSENIIKLTNVINNNRFYILEIENFDMNLNNYLNSNPFFENGDISIFKKIILTLVHALKDLKGKGIIHRNIKPENIYKLESEDDSVEDFKIRLANFDCAIYAKDVENSKQMGTFLYLAPEIINNSKYDEKSDYWSLGVTLFKLYFGNSPFGQDANKNKIHDIINGNEEFIYKKSYIPTLDVLFKRLLCINPDERMTLEELCDFVENENFLKENQIYDNSKYPKYKYTKIYEEIKKEKQIEYDNEILESYQVNKEIISSFPLYFKRINYNGNIEMNNEIFKEEPKFNNILYFDEINDDKYKDNIYSDCEYFEENTPGSFIFCSNKEDLDVVKNEILEEFNKNRKYIFNLITTGSSWENHICKFLDENSNFKTIIKNVCIYCHNIKKYNNLPKKYNIIKAVWCTRDPVVNFIKKSSSENIIPFPLVKLVTYENYKKKYNTLHLIISLFYGENNEKTFEENYEKMEKLIDKEKECGKLKKSKKILKESFKKFKINQDKDEIKNMKLIIREYTEETFYGDFNKWQMSLNVKYYLTTAYFLSRLIYSLNQYGSQYYYKKGIVYRGITTKLYNILPYKRALKRVIFFPALTSTSIEEKIGRRWAKREEYENKDKNNNNNKKDFSVLFYIKNESKKDWISNGVDVHDIARYKNEKEVLFQAFSFFYVEKVEINIKEKKADIHLKTVGKKCILEEGIKLGKEIEYNPKENIMEIID